MVKVRYKFSVWVWRAGILREGFGLIIIIISDPMNDSAMTSNKTKIIGTPNNNDSKLASPFSPFHFKRRDIARNSGIFMAESPFPSIYKRGFLSRMADGTYSNSNTPVQLKNYTFHHDEDGSHNGDDASFNQGAVMNSPYMHSAADEHLNYEGPDKLNPSLFSPATREMID